MSESGTEGAFATDVLKVAEGFTIGLTFGLAAIVYAMRDKRTARVLPTAG